MIDKTLVRKRFSRNLKTYKDNSIVQSKMADRLVSMINRQPEKILELGCGSGLLTEKLVREFSAKDYCAIDIVEECRDYIGKISPDIKFYQSDIETYEFQEKYDLIISNAVFQWIEDLPEFIEKLKNCLTPNGVLLFSTFGTDNLLEISKLTGAGLKYKTVQELNSLLKPQEIFEDRIELEFDTPKDVLKHLKYTGVNAICNNHWTKSDLKEFENGYKTICPNGIKLTYNPIYVMICV